MYHDQGHIPMKLIDFERTVNVSLGIPIIRTSVDHGTAFDIAGQQSRRRRNMKAAMRMAVKMAAGRSQPRRSTLPQLRRRPANMQPLDVIVIAVYMALLVGVGMRVSRRQNTTDEYFLAERSVPGWAVGMSLLATIITSRHLHRLSRRSLRRRLVAARPRHHVRRSSSRAIGIVVVPFFRHVVAMCVYEYFGKRFGPAVRMYSSFAFAVGHFSKMGFVFYLLALVGRRHHRLDLTRSSSSSSASSPSSTPSSAA